MRNLIMIVGHTPVYLDVENRILTFEEGATIDMGFLTDHGLRVKGVPVDPEMVKGIILPLRVCQFVPDICLGSQCYVTYNGILESAVVYDTGPDRKIGGISPALAKVLGIPDGGTPEGVRYRIHLGMSAVVDGFKYDLQELKL